MGEVTHLGAPRRGRSPQGLTPHPDLALGRRRQAGQQAQQGGLAPAVAAPQPDDVAGVKGQIETLEEAPLAPAGSQALHFQQWRVGALRSGLDGHRGSRTEPLDSKVASVPSRRARVPPVKRPLSV